MGKTVPSYRMALEWEIGKWKGFRNALASEEDQAAFDELMDMCRKYASESSCATNPIIFEPMAMSILLFQQKCIRQLERELKAIKPDIADSSAVPDLREAIQIEPKKDIQMNSSGGEQSRFR
jgi:hypothetical protein